MSISLDKLISKVYSKSELTHIEVESSIRKHMKNLGWVPNHGDDLDYRKTYVMSFKCWKFAKVDAVYQGSRCIIYVEDDNSIIYYRGIKQQSDLEALLLKLTDLTFGLK
jgi:hypothetical protein